MTPRNLQVTRDEEEDDADEGNAKFREQSARPPDTGKPRAVGFIGLAGPPNIGKSTLVNHIIGQKICIVSDRPQTTRVQTLGIYTDARMQAIFVDIPGILDPRDRFNEMLMHCATDGLAGCDLILHLRDARRPNHPADGPVLAAIRACGKPSWLVWNKLDRVAGRMFPAGSDDYSYGHVFGISGKTGRGVPPLLDALAESLPQGELLYDPEQVSDRDLRFLAAELVREKLFRYLGAEIPYATAALTETFDEEREGKVYLRIQIILEREAHKPIVIGEKGSMLKKIGQAARLDLERMLGRPIYLDLWVKVHPRWRENERELIDLGLASPGRRE